jgi:hypothetical protein
MSSRQRRWAWLAALGAFEGERHLAHYRKMADGFIVRGEFRRDWSSEAFFPGRLGASDPHTHQSTALLGGIWVIGNKTGTW